MKTTLHMLKSSNVALITKYAGVQDAQTSFGTLQTGFPMVG